jgi:hypothetical protein
MPSLYTDEQIPFPSIPIFIPFRFVSSTKKLLWLFLSPRFSFSVCFLREYSYLSKMFECSCMLDLLVGCVNGTQPRVLGSKSDSLRWNPKQLSQFGSLCESDQFRTRVKVRRGFPGDPIVTSSPLISFSLINCLRGSRCVTPDFLLVPVFWLESVSVPTSRLV